MIVSAQHSVQRTILRQLVRRAAVTVDGDAKRHIRPTKSNRIARWYTRLLQFNVTGRWGRCVCHIATARDVHLFVVAIEQLVLKQADETLFQIDQIVGFIGGQVDLLDFTIAPQRIEIAVGVGV